MVLKVRNSAREAEDKQNGDFPRSNFFVIFVEIGMEFVGVTIKKRRVAPIFLPKKNKNKKHN